MTFYFHTIQCRGVSGRTLLKCSLEFPCKVLTKHVLPGLAATLVFISPTYQVCTIMYCIPESKNVYVEFLDFHAVSSCELSIVIPRIPIRAYLADNNLLLIIVACNCINRCHYIFLWISLPI